MSEIEKPLSILWISHLIPYPPKGGVLMRSNYLVTEVAKRHNVDLLALNQAKLMRAYYSLEAEGLGAAKDALGGLLFDLQFVDFEASSDNRKQKQLAITSLISTLPYSIGWFRSDSLAGAIAKKCARKRYDIVHFDTVGLAQYRDLVGDVPTVLDHHNVESHMMLRRAAKEGNVLKKLYFWQEGLRLRRYERNVLPLFDGHITCSDVDRERLLDLASDLDVRTVPNSVHVDNSYRPEYMNRGAPRVLFIGGLDWYPNRDAVIHFCREIWPKVASAVSEVEFDIVGKSPCRKVLDFARADSRIKVHGFVDDIDHFYRQSDVFVCPVRDGGGTKLKVLDAMGHFLPVVGYAEAHEGIEATDGQDAAVVHTSEQFASRLLELLCDRGQARQIGENARTLVHSKYEAGRVGRELSEYYMEVAGMRQI